MQRSWWPLSLIRSPVVLGNLPGFVVWVLQRGHHWGRRADGENDSPMTKGMLAFGQPTR
jgi:hypothetical protein